MPSLPLLLLLPREIVLTILELAFRRLPPVDRRIYALQRKRDAEAVRTISRWYGRRLHTGASRFGRTVNSLPRSAILRLLLRSAPRRLIVALPEFLVTACTLRDWPRQAPFDLVALTRRMRALGPLRDRRCVDAIRFLREFPLPNAVICRASMRVRQMLTRHTIEAGGD
jgi:hypothetical protein